MRVDVMENGAVVNVIEVESLEAARMLGFHDVREHTGAGIETDDMIFDRYDKALTKHLDDVARSYRYEDRKSFALRAGYPNPWQAEGIAFGTWMDTCNALSYKLADDVRAGTVSLPSIEEFLDDLPIFVKP